MNSKILSTLIQSPTKTCAVSFIGASLGYLFMTKLRRMLFRRPSRPSLPPGPPRDPLIGTLRSFPKGQFIEGFSEWAVTYGDIVYCPLPGMDIVILNSYEVAHELLAKRPHTTAARNVSYLVVELMGWNWLTTLLQPGPSHLNQRKMLRRAIGPQRVGTHDTLIESDVTKLMTVLGTFQGNPSDTVQHWIGRMVSKAAYGNKVWDEMGEELSHWNMEAMDLITEAVFAFWLVDIFHFLRFIPDWVPGLRFKKLARKGSDLSEKIRYKAYQRGAELYKSGTLGHSILHDLLDEFGESEDVQDAAGILYTAASDTTTGGIIQFLHALFLFPEVSKRVYEEIQSVTHGQRLPQIRDRNKLPYTDAVFKEAIRWRPFMSLGVPHVNENDEIIRGHFIPKGTVIHQNNRMMLNDPKVWGDPEVFRPERWLEPGASQKPNPHSVQFGWGMRVCSGMYLADRVMFHIVTTVVSLYNVEPLEGQKIPDPNSIEYLPRAVQQPAGFECRFVVRDERARELLKAVSLDD
ncbi:cytochrome P450 [Serendipita vermifera]|nr:cytochrome P450 [Serendipita vermifera]